MIRERDTPLADVANFELQLQQLLEFTVINTYTYCICMSICMSICVCDCSLAYLLVVKSTFPHIIFYFCCIDSCRV